MARGAREGSNGTLRCSFCGKSQNDVRKLKELGLTISFSPGYELSPRGKALLEALEDV